jgi:hypothetical protein
MLRFTVLVFGLAAFPGSLRADVKQVALDGKTALLSPVTHDNLTLFPVVARGDRVRDIDYLVLDEGMKKKLVAVLEKDRDGTVNELTLRNRSDQPLFLMAGEVVIGGKQDRIIGKNTIVAPRTTETVPVFCVEHGRWSGRKANFETAQTLAHTELRKQASFADQSAVWKEVKAKNAKRKVANSTDTYRAVARSGSVKRSIGGYQKAFASALRTVPGKDKQVGYVVALGGQVVAIETFGSPRLFRKFEDKLLRSYFVEAVDAERRADGKPAEAPKPAAVQSFAARARSAKRKVVLDKKSGKTMQFEEQTLKGSRVESAAGDEVYQGAYE